MLSVKTIDLAIGVVLLYLLLTFAASALLELLSVAANWRAQMLHDAVANMLQDSTLATVEDIYNNPQILALSRNNAAPSKFDFVDKFGWKPPRDGTPNGGTPPSYIPAASFSGAVLEAVLNRADGPFELSPDGVVKALRHLLTQKVHTSHKKCACCAKTCDEDALQSVLRTTLATQGASIQAIRFAIEKWFNDTMDRVSGWYKRRTQCCLLFIGLAIAYGGNVSTVEVARWLWQSDSARQAVVAAATEMAAKGLPQPPKTVDAMADRIVWVDRRIVDLQYPVGWKMAGLKDPMSWLGGYLVGCLLTAIAISMGSTFWFDALQNLVKIRGAGPKPGGR
jgi:hypothetical protein